ncbi:hypothetical protein ACJ41O_010026 [Fusarium nematophilum]
MAHLPNEIWLAVFQCFEASLPLENWEREVCTYTGYMKTLRSLSLVCKRFRSLARCLMYRTLPLRVRDPAPRHLLLARALASQPGLGLVARRVSLLEFELPADAGWDLDLALARSMKTAVQAVDAAPGVKERLRSGLPLPPYESKRRASGLSLPAFLLALMPRVRLVECHNVARSHPVLLWMLGGGIGDDQDRHANFLPDLVELRLGGSKARMRPMSIGDVEGVLLHPTLKTLRLVAIDWREDDMRQRMRWPNQPCNLQHLSLREASVDVPAVRSILSRCENLETLAISLRAVMYTRLDLCELCRTIRELGHNLVSFELDTWDFERLSECVGSIACFAELFSLPRLRYVDIKTLELRGWRLKRPVQAPTDRLFFSYDLTLQG